MWSFIVLSIFHCSFLLVWFLCLIYLTLMALFTINMPFLVFPLPLLMVFLFSKSSYLSSTPISWSFNLFSVIQIPPILRSSLGWLCHGHFYLWALVVFKLCTTLCFLVFFIFLCILWMWIFCLFELSKIFYTSLYIAYP